MAAYGKNQRTYERRHKAKRNEATKALRRNIHAAIVAFYGGQCSCCGESQPKFLTLDHVNGGGSQHRRQVGGPAAVYWALWREVREGIKNPDYQVLCFNCNCGRQRNKGVCPHEETT